MNIFYSDDKTDLKLRCNCIWISSYLRVPKMMLLDWQLYVACYYPTTPTDYPSTTRGVSVGPSVAVNIEFCGYLRFLSISFVWIVWVQYATDKVSCQQLVLASWASVDISTHSEPQSKRYWKRGCQNHISQLGKWGSYEKWRRIYRCLGGGGGYIPALEWKPDLQESRCMASHSS